MFDNVPTQRCELSLCAYQQEGHDFEIVSEKLLSGGSLASPQSKNMHVRYSDEENFPVRVPSVVFLSAQIINWEFIIPT